jgi:outer membrane receptor protein involved in Fe transport
LGRHNDPGIGCGGFPGGYRSLMIIARLTVAAALASVLLGGGPVRAQPAGAETDEELEPMSLEELLNAVVTTASGSTEQRSIAAANVFVISSREIERRGWRSLQEILEQVPGLYIVDDHVAPSVGVREVTGGFRGGTRIVKVMVDGNPVSFRPDLNAFIGPEFIPISAIDRVEVAKGPLSALYGANAFLATVNVITNKPTVPSSASAHSVIRDRYPGYGGSAMATHGDARKGVLVAVSAERVDRSGLRPTPSFANQDAASAVFNRRSTNDISSPQSVFLRLHYESDRAGELLLSGGYQRLDVGGEFQLNSILTHLTRVALTNQWASFQYSKALSEAVRVRALVGAASGSPEREYQLFLTDSRDAFYRPNYGYRSLNGLLELTLQASPALSLKLGGDSELAREDLLFYTQVLLNQQDMRQTLDEVDLIDPADPQSADSVQFGAYLQLSGNPVPEWNDLIFTGNGRVDFITFGKVTFPRQYSWRAALAFRPHERFTTKVVAGRAFQTPSGTLLYSQGGVGNTRNVIGSERLQEPARLRPQVVTSVDVVTAAQLGSFATVEATGFHQVLDDAIEFVQAGPFFVARNRGQRTTSGLELTLRLALGMFYPYAVASLTRNALDSLEGGRAPALYPAAHGYGGIDFDPVTSHFGANVEVRWTGSRGGSQGNVYTNDSRPYNLPSYTDLGATVRLKQLRLLAPTLETRLLASVKNLLDRRRLEPGFAGIDIPQPGRTFMVSLHQDL